MLIDRMEQQGDGRLLGRREAIALTAAAAALPARVALAEEADASAEVAAGGETAASADGVVPGADEGLSSWRYADGQTIEYPVTDAEALQTLATTTKYPYWNASYGTDSYAIATLVEDSEGEVQSISYATVSVPDTHTVGIDVSRWQGDIDWEEVADDGITFAIIRCLGHTSSLTSVPDGSSYYESVTDSGYYYDEPGFATNVAEALKAGLRVGLYLYSLATSVEGAAQEAALALAAIEDAGIDAEDLGLPVFLDMEDSSTLVFDSTTSDSTTSDSTTTQTFTGAALLGEVATEFCGTLEAAGFEVGIYANRTWWTTYLTDEAFDTPSWYKWGARYPLSTSVTSCGVDDLLAWQFTSKGYVSGISTNVDVDFGYFANSYSAEFVELAGETRYDTMAEIAAEAYGSASSSCAVVASGANFPDALAAAPLAGVLGAPVVLTKPQDASAAVAVLTSLGVEDVYVVGGTSAVSAGVVSSIEAAVSGTVTRIAGATRQATAIAIASAVNELAGSAASSTCIVAAGANFPDALSASPYAYWSCSPVYLANNDGSLSAATLAAIEAGGYERIVVMGGSAAITTAAYSALRALGAGTVDRVYGDDRYETSAVMARWCLRQGMGVDGAAVATGANFPDALAGATLCGRAGSVLLLAAKGHDDARELLADYVDEVGTLYFLGGTSALGVAERLSIKGLFAE